MLVVIVFFIQTQGFNVKNFLKFKRGTKAEVLNSA